MKLLLLPAVLATALSGCVAVPYDDPYAVYSAPAPVYGSLPAYSSPPYYAAAPVYGVPVPAYGPPVYVEPPVQFGFGLNYWSGGGGFHGHPHHHGFWPRRFNGGRGTWGGRAH